MKILKINETNLNNSIQEIIESLKSGGLVVFPTETCYGVAVLATDENAVKKLIEYKRRPEGKAISIVVKDKEMASKYVEINKEAENIYDNLLPGPITVISNSKGVVSKLLEAEDGTLGIRVPDHIVPKTIVESLNLPFTATSANSNGKKTPYTIDDILNNITEKQKNLIDLIIDYGELPHNPPSTVINTTKAGMQVLREGSIAIGENLIQEQINSEEEMIEQGRKFIIQYSNLLNTKAIIIMFNAELGAGKTHFTKGIAKGLNINKVVSSPTYSIIEEYDFEFRGENKKLIHIDAWRLESINEFQKLGIEEYIQEGNVIIVEWAGETQEFFEKLNNQKVFKVSADIKYLDDKKRELRIYVAR